MTSLIPIAIPPVLLFSAMGILSQIDNSHMIVRELKYVILGLVYRAVEKELFLLLVVLIYVARA